MSSLLWNMTQGNPTKVYRSFKGTCHFHLQEGTIGQTRSQHEALLAICFTLVSALAYSSTPKMEVLVTFNGLHGIISQKTEVFLSLHICCYDALWNKYIMPFHNRIKFSWFFSDRIRFYRNTLIENFFK
jgi:hypothetical protein